MAAGCRGRACSTRNSDGGGDSREDARLLSPFRPGNGWTLGKFLQDPTAALTPLGGGGIPVSATVDANGRPHGFAKRQCDCHLIHGNVEHAICDAAGSTLIPVEPVVQYGGV